MSRLSRADIVMSRMGDIKTDEWFKQDYTPAVYEEDEGDVLIDDEDLSLHETPMDSNKVPHAPTHINAFELVEMSSSLDLFGFFEKEDGLSDLDDYLTKFMGTMDVHKLLEPAWCRTFRITLCRAVRFWYDNLSPESIDSFHQLREKFRANFLQQRRFQKTQAEIIGIRQREEEYLKHYLARFGKETLHMIDRSDGMITGAFISGLRLGRAFKELIAQLPVSLEDLYIYINGFIRYEEANNANRCRDSKG
ncbi:gag protein [Tanacetum coccineum]|uniref:Gag protein n=1 Tax=Tanacetum coccineum TaxID=301880 RepID=A0ABQ5CXM0_9ASTR